MKIKLHSRIVGYRHPPGTILVVGQDINEDQGRALLSMGKEASLIEECQSWFGLPSQQYTRQEKTDTKPKKTSRGRTPKRKKQTS